MEIGAAGISQQWRNLTFRLPWTLRLPHGPIKNEGGGGGGGGPHFRTVSHSTAVRLTRPVPWPSRSCALLSTASSPCCREHVRYPGPHCHRAQLCWCHRSSPLPPPPEPRSCSEPPFSAVHPRPCDPSPEPAAEPWSTLCTRSTLPLLEVPSLH